MSEQIHLQVSPAKALVDEPVDITVEGLNPGQPVTLHAHQEEEGARFQSYAHYRADEKGRVAVAEQPSLGGLYTGVSQMGLFWSMQQSPGQRPGLRLRKRDVTTPFLIDISVHEGHVDMMGQDKLPSLATMSVERRYLGKDVKRIPVREGRIRGTLFVPPGSGRFPGVIDMFGGTGGLPEYRSALLGSHGFATLALAYVNYDNLPKYVTDLDLDYFEEAADWLLRQPCVQGPGLGAVSVSKGGEIVLTMAVYLKQVAAVVAIGSFAVTTVAPLPYKQKDIVLPCAEMIMGQATFTSEDFAVSKNILEDLTVEPGCLTWIQLEKARCPIMFVAGEDDLSTPAVDQAKQAIARMKAHGKDNYTLLSYPGAGHLIEPPYTPHYKAYFMQVFGTYMAAGGNPKDHAVAQEDSWFKILDFFRKHLGKDAVKSKL